MKRELQKLSSDKEGETSKDHLIAQLQQKLKKLQERVQWAE